ncbi:nicotinate-nucleotide adenylyltransferase [Spongiibacter sp.]|uniref:nicotinate-nucleotide adenylyltransferase n=1 Tax=Spongiibacter sp. TaxID=2024860 RepID=UPI0035636AB4
MAASRRHIVVFGGTFDPIHNGHLRSAIELRELLVADEVRLMPSHQPPLRGRPGASSAQRLAMVEAAVAEVPELQVDDRELRRDGASYTVDSLREMRQELGDEVALTAVVGSDAYAKLHRWQHWQQLLDYANLMVIERADHPLQADAVVADTMAACRVALAADLGRRAAGGFYSSKLIQLPISATDIRDRLAAGRSIHYLLPAAVAEQIARWGLYQDTQTGTEN